LGFQEKGLERSAPVDSLTLFAEVAFRINFKAERVAEGRVSRLKSIVVVSEV
jgi:hypothetical protein